MVSSVFETKALKRCLNVLISFQSLSWSGPLLLSGFISGHYSSYIIFPNSQSTHMSAPISCSLLVSWNCIYISSAWSAIFLCIFFFFLLITTQYRYHLFQEAFPSIHPNSWVQVLPELTTWPTGIPLMALCWWLVESWNFIEDPSDSRALSLAVVQCWF